VVKKHITFQPEMNDSRARYEYLMFARSFHDCK
jgi:hypothetical protein